MRSGHHDSLQAVDRQMLLLLTGGQVGYSIEAWPIVVTGLVVCAGLNESAGCAMRVVPRHSDLSTGGWPTQHGVGVLLLLLQISRCRPSKQYSLVTTMPMSFCIILCFIVCVFYFLLFPAAFVPIKLMMMIGLTQQYF